MAENPDSPPPITSFFLTHPMLRLIDELTFKKTRPLRRSVSQRSIIRRILALSLGLAILYYVHQLIRHSSPKDFPRDMELVRSFCSGVLQQQQQQPKQQTFPPGSSDKLTEYNRAWHLRTDYTPDSDRIPDSVWKHLPVKGVLYMTVRNEDLQAVRATIRSLEDRYNHKFGYPWVLLSNHYLSADFRKYVRKLTTNPVYFGKIDLDAWSAPNFIRVKDLEHMLQQMQSQNVENGDSLFYRERMRYNAGFYFFHPLFQDVEYSWRVEPGTHYTCDLQSDPFQRMKQGDKTLGFIQTQQQPPITMRNFWGIVDQFIHQFSGHVLPSNRTIMPWLKDASDEYNFCHIWSTSEIVDLSFLRSQVYQAFFSYLDSTGGFFYERWGDGAVQTAAAALFLDRDELLFLNDVGHSYAERTHCPPSLRHMEHCSCEVASNLDFNPNSCTISLLQYIDNEAIAEMTEFAYTYYSRSERLESFASNLFPATR